MNTQDVLNFYARRLRELQELDAEYYNNPNPNSQQRGAYYQRQALAEDLRAELRALESAQAPMVENADTFRVLLCDGGGQKISSSPQCRLSHDLKNCLHIVLGSAQMLSPRVSNDPDAEELVQHIVTAVSRMNDLLIKARCRILPPDSTNQPSRQAHLNIRKPPAGESAPLQQQIKTHRS